MMVFRNLYWAAVHLACAGLEYGAFGLMIGAIAIQRFAAKMVREPER